MRFLRTPAFYFWFRKAEAYCLQYQAVLDALGVAGDTPPGAIAAQQDLMIRTLVDGTGWQDEWDLLYLLSQYSNNGNGGFINLINPGTYDGTIIPNGGALTFTSLEGYKSDGNAYVNTGFNAGDGGTYNYKQNDGAIIIYSRTNSAITQFDAGVRDGAVYAHVGINWSTNQILGRMNGANPTLFANGSSLGLFAQNRALSTHLEFYINKTSSGNQANVSNGVPNGNFYLWGYNVGGTPTSITDRQYSLFGIRKSVTQAIMNVISDAVETYMDYNGKGVMA